MYILRKTENGTTADIGMYDTLERLVNAAAGHAKNRQEHGRLIPLYGAEETGDLDDVCTMAVQTFSDTENNTVCIEELSELQKEVCKRMRGAENDDHMSEEIADAEICIEKLKLRYGLRDRTEEWRRKKVERLRRKIEGRADGSSRTPTPTNGGMVL